MAPLRVAAVVLAAGKSQRMGRNKLILRIGGRTVLDRVLSSIEASGVEEVYVVLGHRPEDLVPIVEAHSAEAVPNPDYEEGMTSSFKTGLSRVSVDAAFLCLGDQVVLDPVLMDRMIDAMEAHPEALIVSPVHEGKRGHPVLFRDTLFPEIMGLGSGDTMKDVVEGHGDRHMEVEGDVWCTLDMDTPEDYEMIRERLAAEP
ncbi:MAG: nucleotidyltransferase family protein [Candidatus Bathyarchaeota archaeon]|nr:nucleotidyltransferase family protein [Candidatus Bathyarchaeota archaeon]